MTKHPLKHPIEISEKKTISELPLVERPRAKDYLAYDKQGRNAQLISLIASMTNQDESIIERLDGEDFKELSLICDQMAYPEFYDTSNTPQQAAEAVAKKE